MFWFILLGLMLLLALGGVLMRRAAKSALARDEQDEDAPIVRAIGTAVIVAAVVIFVAISLFRMVHTVEAGHVGVVYTFNDVTGQIGSGLQFTAPWQSVKVASTQVQREQFELTAFSEETQDVFIKATLNYETNPDAIQDLYRNVGSNWFDRLVEARVLQIFKDESVKYESVDIAPNREAIRVSVRNRLRAELSPYSIDVVDLLLDNIDFQPEFKKAIEDKQIATQEALRAEELVKKAEFEASQKIETAKGQAEANRLLDASLTDQLVQWRAIETFNEDVEIILVPSGEGLLLDPSTFMKPKG